MEWFINHRIRVLAVSLLVIFSLMAADTIGTVGRCEPFTWGQALHAIAMIAAVMFAGFAAGREGQP